MINDTNKSHLFNDNVDTMSGFYTKSILALPLIARSRVVGVLEVLNKPGGFTAKDLDLAMTLADSASIALENARLYKKAEMLTFIDDLTGLYNQRYIDRLLPEYLKSRLPLSFVFMDLDNFKRINDTYGHQAGSEVLQQVGNAIKESVPAKAVCSRFGGDEFTIVFPEMVGDQALVYAQKLLLAICQCGYGDLTISASIGLSTVENPGVHLDMVIQAADKAMYEVKYSGKNGVLWVPLYDKNHTSKSD